MGYTGHTAPIPLGQLGLRTDDSMTSLPPNAAIKANNVDFFSSRLEKSKGTVKFNSASLGTPVVGLYDWFPDPSNQRTIAVGSNGSIYKASSTTFSSIRTNLNSYTDSCFLSSGGQEASGATKKLFIFAAQNPTQIVEGDLAVARNIAYPASDWLPGAYPTVGIVYQNRMVAASKHFIYFSNSFSQNIAPLLNNPTWYNLASPSLTTSPFLDWYSTVDPSLNVTYYTVQLYDQGTGTPASAISNTTNTSYQFIGLSLTNGHSYTATVKGYDVSNTLKQNFISQAFLANTAATGAGSLFSVYGHEDFRPNDGVNTFRDAAFFQVFPGEGDEIIGLNVYKGRLFIFKKPYGVYYLNTNNSFSPVNWGIQKLTDSFGIGSAHSVIQPQDDLVILNNTNSITSAQATQAFGDIKAGDILANNQVEQYYKSQFNSLGIAHSQAVYYAEKKKAYFTGRSANSTKQNQMLIIDVARQNPRFSIENKDQPTCLSLRKGTDNIPRPFYGSDDGNIYLMEQPSYNVNGTSYNAEFQTPYTDMSYLDPSMASKNKIFDFLEVQFVATGNWAFFVDVFTDNRFVETVKYAQQAGAALDSFILDTSKLAVEFTQELRLPIHSTGRRISFRIYNNGLNQYFKIEKLIVSFRISGEQQTGASGNFSV